MDDSTLTRVANFASSIEADFAVSLLESAEINAVALSNDTIGIFGPGFMGPSARGVDVLVRADQVEAARAVLDEAELDAP